MALTDGYKWELKKGEEATSENMATLYYDYKETEESVGGNVAIYLPASLLAESVTADLLNQNSNIVEAHDETNDTSWKDVDLPLEYFPALSVEGGSVTYKSINGYALGVTVVGANTGWQTTTTVDNATTMTASYGQYVYNRTDGSIPSGSDVFIDHTVATALRETNYDLVLEGLKVSSTALVTPDADNNYTIVSGNIDTDTQIKMTTNNDKIKSGKGYNIALGSAANFAVDVVPTRTITITGSSGNDSISVLKAASTTTPNEDGQTQHGTQTLTGGIVINAGAGNDSISVVQDSKNVTINADAGDDTISIGGGSTELVIDAGAGNDSITIGTQAASLEVTLGAGSDTINVDGSNHTIDATDGNDYISLANNATVTLLSGSNDSDTIKISGTAGISINGLDSTDILEFDTMPQSGSFEEGALKLGDATITVVSAGSTNIDKQENLTHLYNLKVKAGDTETNLGDLIDSYAWRAATGNQSVTYGQEYGDNAGLMTISGVTVGTNADLTESITLGTVEGATYSTIKLAESLLDSNTLLTTPAALTFKSGQTAYTDTTVKFVQGDLAKYDSTAAVWAATTTDSVSTVTYTAAASTIGYIVTDKSISYNNEEKPDYSFNVAGLKGTLTHSDAKDTTSSYNGVVMNVADSSVSVALTSAVVGKLGEGDTVKISSEVAGYDFKLALGTGLNTISGRNGLWFSEKGESTTTVTYTNDGETAGYELEESDTAIVYHDATTGTALFTLEGLKGTSIGNKSEVASLSGITLNSKDNTYTVTLTSAVVGTLSDGDTIKIEEGDGAGASDTFKLALGSLSTISTRGGLWFSEKGDNSLTTVTYTNDGKTKGYELDESDTTIIYHDATTGTALFTLEGLKGTSIGNKSEVASLSGITLNSKDNTYTVTLTSAVVGTLSDGDTIKIAAGDAATSEDEDAEDFTFKLALGSLSTISTRGGLWFSEKGDDSLTTVTYTNDGKTKGHELNEDSDTITYHDATTGTALFTLEGLKGTSIGNKSEVASLNGITLNSKDNTYTVTLTSAVVGTLSDGDTIKIEEGDGAGASDTFKLALGSLSTISTRGGLWFSETDDDESTTKVIYTNDGETAGYELEESDTTIVYHDATTGTALFTLEGLKAAPKHSNTRDNTSSFTGISLTSNKNAYTVTLAQSALTSLEVGDTVKIEGNSEIEGDYTFALALDSKVTQPSLRGNLWLIDEDSKDDEASTVSVIYTSGGRTKGFELQFEDDGDGASDTIVYADATTGTALFTIEGLNSALKDPAKDGEAPDKAFEVSSNTVTITSAAALAETDISVVSAEGNSVTYNVVLSASLQTLTSVKINDIAPHWETDTEVDDSIIFYSTGKTKGYENVTDEETSATYVAHSDSVAGDQKATITGFDTSKLKEADLASNGTITQAVSGNFIVMTKAILDNMADSDAGVTLESASYSFSLANDAVVQNTVESWAVNTTTGLVTYTEAAYSAGYKIDSDDKDTTEDSNSSSNVGAGDDDEEAEVKTYTISKSAARGGASITISGLNKKTTKLNSSKKVGGISITGEEDSKEKVINVDTGLLADSNVSLNSSAKGLEHSYTFSIDSDLDPQEISSYWKATSSGTAILYSSGITDGYELNSDSTVINYTKATDGDSDVKITGLKSNVTSKVRTAADSVTTYINGIDYYEDSDSKTVVISANLIDKGGVSVSGSEGGYTYALGGKSTLTHVGDNEVSLSGSTGNDVIINKGKGTATIDGGRGNDSIIAGASDTVIASSGNDTVSLTGSTATVEYLAGKVVIQGYKAGNTISIGDEETELEVKKSAYKSNNLTLTIGSGSLTFASVGTASVTVGDTVYSGYNIYTEDKKKLSFSEGVTGTITVEKTVEEVDAGNLSVGITINGGTTDTAITATKKNDSINTGAGNNVIDAGAGNDTIIIGTGENTIIGGAGNDLFVYSGGNDTIADYGIGNDKISLASSISVAGSAIDESSSDITLTLSNKKTLTLEKADGKAININGTANYYLDGAVLNAKKTAATLYATTTEFEAANNTIVTIDGSASTVTGGISIVGNAKANSIKAGSKGSTLDGGAGNDTLIGGSGKDLFVYDGRGKDVIVGYGSGDSISISGGLESITGSTIKNKDTILTVGKQTLTIKEAPSTLNVNGETYIFGNGYYSDAKGTEVTMYSTFKGNFNTDSSNSTFSVLDGSAVKNAMKINGNSKANTIQGGLKADSINGGEGNDSLNGGLGNDTLYGGAGNDTLTGDTGNDVFVYDGLGNDVITDYTAGKDKIRINGTIKSWTADEDGGKVTFNVEGSGSGTLTVNFAETGYAATQKITVIENGKSTTKSYAAGTSYTATNASSRTLDLLYDNNFIASGSTLDDIAPISDTKFAVGDVKTTDATNLTPDQTSLTYGDDDKK